MTLSITSYAAIAGDATLMNQLNSGTFPNTAVFQVLGIIYNLVVLVPVCGIIYLPAIAKRAKWDMSLRRHFIWFVPSIMGVLFLFFGGGVGSLGPYGSFLTALVIVLIGYTLYRRAKALVPLNRVSPSATQ